jgi:septin family protein
MSQSSVWSSPSGHQSLAGSSSTTGDHSAAASAAGLSRTPQSTEHEDARSRRRERNTLAARKYRQKRLDRIAELEQALMQVTRERDDLKVQLARQESETKILKEVLESKAKA